MRRQQVYVVLKSPRLLMLLVLYLVVALLFSCATATTTSSSARERGSVGIANPLVVGLNDGGFLVSYWTEDLATKTDVTYGQLFNSSGLAVGQPFLVAPGELDYTSNSMVLLANGNVAVAFAYNVPNEVAIYVYTYVLNPYTGKAIGPTIQLNGPKTQWAASNYNPCVAPTTTGGYVVVWVANTGGQPASLIYGQFFDGFGHPIGQQFLVSVNGNKYYPPDWPTCASLTWGGLAVVWQETINAEYDTYALVGQVFNNNGQPVGGQFDVQLCEANGGAYLPNMKSFSDGNFIVTHNEIGVCAQVFSSRNGGVPIMNSKVVNSTVGNGKQCCSYSTVLANQNVLTVWTYTQSPWYTEVFGQVMTQSGQMVGPVFLVPPENVARNFHTLWGVTATLSTGNVVMVWVAGNDLMGQIFDSTVQRRLTNPFVISVGN